MYVYIGVYIYIYIYIVVCACMYISVNVCIYIYIYICICAARNPATGLYSNWVMGVLPVHPQRLRRNLVWLRNADSREPALRSATKFWAFWILVLNVFGGIWSESAMRILENPHCGAQSNFHAFWCPALNDFGWNLVGFCNADSREPALWITTKCSCILKDRL